MEKPDFEVFKAPHASWFNATLGRAVVCGLPHVWKGSVFRCHPCGVIRRGIIFCRVGTTTEECYAEVILDPESKIARYDNDPLTTGNPFPKPDQGGVLRVYQNGRWIEVDGPWRKVIHEVLKEIEAECRQHEAAESARKLDELRQQELERLEQLQRAAEALAIFAKREKSE